MRRFWFALAFAWALSACASPEARDYGDPTSQATATEVDGIVAWVESPSLDGALDTAAPEVVIGAHVSGEDVPLEARVTRLSRTADGRDVTMGEEVAERSGSGEEQRFSLQVGLLHGSNRFLATLQTPDQSRLRRLAFTLRYDGEAPGIVLQLKAPSPDSDTPCSDPHAVEGGLTNAAQACVEGLVTTADGDGATVSLEGETGDGPQQVSTDADGAFAAAVALRPDAAQKMTATARDAAGRETTVDSSIVQDSTPPELTLTTRARETSDPTLTLEGMASDESGVEAVELQSDGQTELRATQPDAWELVVALAAGEQSFDLVARDRAGNETTLPLSLIRTRILWLAPPEPEAGATSLDLGREEINSLLSVEDQEAIEMVALDVEPTVREALLRIREPERFGVDTSEWGDAEHNLQRILAMTADNADLSGTTLEELLEISDALGLPSPRILADLIDLSVTEPIVDIDALTGVVMDQLVGTHPSIGQEDSTFVMNVSLHDVLQDLTTLASRFGPSGDHPGFLSGETFSPVLEPGFRITFPVKSNLTQYDAVDLSRATKDYHFLIEGDRVLDFNVFTDDFSVVGLQDEPSVDLRFVLQEHPGPGMLQAGTNRTARPDAEDEGFFRGDGEGWGIDPWLFERVAVEAAYRVFHRRYEDAGFMRTVSYDTGSINDAAVLDWDHGWVTIETAGGVGNPPPPVYLWDFIMEVAQVRLHDGGISEGDANMAFMLTDVPIGLSADELVEKLRPKLDEQQDTLSEQLVGEIGLATPRAELFYMPSDAGDGALAFPAPEDSEVEYAYTAPGFFEDAALTTKVSTFDPVGGVDEALHEKVPATPGEVYFAADEEGIVYEIEVVAREGEQVGLRVRSMGDAT